MDVLVVDMDPLWYSERTRRGAGEVGEEVSGVSGSLEPSMVVWDEGEQGRLSTSRVAISIILYFASVHCPPSIGNTRLPTVVTTLGSNLVHAIILVYS